MTDHIPVRFQMICFLFYELQYVIIYLAFKYTLSDIWYLTSIVSFYNRFKYMLLTDYSEKYSIEKQQVKSVS